jgi:hypothetical protein
MRPKMIVVLCAAFAAMTVMLATSPADAQEPRRIAVKKQRVVPVARPANRVVLVRNRPATRIVVRGRSYLDAGTEVLPGERKFTDYVDPPGGYSALRNADVFGGFRRQPLPDPFDLPGSRLWGN